MGGLSLTPKYVIYATIEIDGLVDKTDVIGAIFGQTEGLLGEDLELRELQRTGKIGRLEVRLERSNNKTVGHLEIPSNLDKVETALVAAAVEEVEKVGPYNARIRVTDIKDMRGEKRRRIVQRARELLQKLESRVPETRELTEEVLKAVRAAEVVEYGPERLPAGPDVDRADTIIVVEGRADVVNLVKHGYRNVIAVGGAKVPKTIVELSKRKDVILFVDGDRGGELIIRNLLAAADVDYIARAPPGREVEELTGKEIAKALRSKVPVDEYLEVEKRKEAKEERPAVKLNIPEEVVKTMEELKGTLEAVLYDESWKPLKRVAVRDLYEELTSSEGVSYVVFDGIITQRVIDAAVSKGVKVLIGARVGDVARIPEGLKLVTFPDLLR